MSRIRFKYYCRKLSFKLFAIFLSFCTILISPFVLLLFFAPIHLFRFVVFKVSPIIRKDLGKMLSTRSNIIAADDLYHKPQATLMSSGILAGDVEVEDARKIIEEKLLNLKHANGNYIYPEFRQKLTYWCGFAYWAWDKNFDIKNHINYYDNTRGGDVCPKEILRIHKELILKPFVRDRSPWEIVIVKNYSEEISSPWDSKTKDDEFSYYFWRVHHTMGDGYSFAKVVINLCREKTNLIPTGTGPKVSIFSKIIFWFRLLFFGLYEGIYQTVEGYDFNAWHSPMKEYSKIPHKCISKPVDLGTLKETAQSNGVSLTSLVSSAVTGGIRKFMDETGTIIPQYCHMGTPLPFPGHPDNKLRNHFTIIFIRIPLGEENEEKRLKKINHKLKSLKNSPVPMLTFISIPLLGGIFPSLLKKIFANRVATFNISSFPGPKRPIEFFGKKLITLNIDASLIPGTCPLMITTVTYNGKMYMVGTGDETVFPSDDHLSRLVFLIIEEFQLYHSKCFV